MTGGRGYVTAVRLGALLLLLPALAQAQIGDKISDAMEKAKSDVSCCGLFK
jgi:hypothetical protein